MMVNEGRRACLRRTSAREKLARSNVSMIHGRVASETKQTDKTKDSIIQAADVLSTSSRTHSSDKQSLDDDVMHRTTLNKRKDELVHVQTVTIQSYSLATNKNDDRRVNPKEGVSWLKRPWFSSNDQSSLSSSIVSTAQTIINGNQANSQSVVTKQSIERASLPSSSQLMPIDSIINDKQVSTAIFNSTSADEQRQILMMLRTKTDSNSRTSTSTSSQLRLQPLVTLISSNSSTFLLSNQFLLAHGQSNSTTNEPFLTETSFIILISTFTVLILLFCLGLFCLCRRHPRRQISPSFDGMARGNSIEIPIGHSHDRLVHLPFKEMPTISPIEQQDNHLLSSPPWPNENLQSTSLHQTKGDQMKLKMPMKKKLKKKRHRLCCCTPHSPSSPTTNTINARTRNR